MASGSSDGRVAAWVPAKGDQREPAAVPEGRRRARRAGELRGELAGIERGAVAHQYLGASARKPSLGQCGKVAKTSRRYSSGSSLWRRADAMSGRRLAARAAWSSLPTICLSSRSEPVLSMLRRDVLHAPTVHTLLSFRHETAQQKLFKR